MLLLNPFSYIYIDIVFVMTYVRSYLVYDVKYDTICYFHMPLAHFPSQIQ